MIWVKKSKFHNPNHILSSHVVRYTLSCYIILYLRNLFWSILSNSTLLQIILYYLI